jgi:hypothetical protein
MNNWSKKLHDFATDPAVYQRRILIEGLHAKIDDLKCENAELKKLNDQLYLACRDACETCRERACENGAGCTIKDAMAQKETVTQRMSQKGGK